MLDSQQGSDERVTARLRQNAVARIDQNDGEIRGRSAGGHVARVLLVPRRVGDDELPFGRGEIAVRDVDGDALFALGAQAVGEQRKVDCAGGLVDRRFADGCELVLVNALGVVKQAADERGLAIVHAAGGGEAEQVLLLVLPQERVDIAGGCRGLSVPRIRNSPPAS